MSDSRLRAEFIRDKEQRLIGIREIDIIHYCIRLFMENLPPKTEKVVYRLHESYGNPRLEVKKGMPQFAEEITSYGDYEIEAHIHYGDKVDTVRVLLSDALSETYRDSNAPEIIEALDQIKRL